MSGHDSHGRGVSNVPRGKVPRFARRGRDRRGAGPLLGDLRFHVHFICPAAVRGAIGPEWRLYVRPLVRIANVKHVPFNSTSCYQVRSASPFHEASKKQKVVLFTLHALQYPPPRLQFAKFDRRF